MSSQEQPTKVTYAVSAICNMARELQLETELPFADPDMQMQWRMSVASNVKVYFPHNPRVSECAQMTLSIATSYIATFGAFAESYIVGSNMPKSIAEELHQDHIRRFNTPEELKAHLLLLRDMWLAYDPDKPHHQSRDLNAVCDRFKAKFDELHTGRVRGTPLEAGSEEYFEGCIGSCCAVILKHLETNDTVSVQDIHYIEFMPWRRKIIRAALDDLEESNFIIQVASLEIADDYHVNYKRTKKMRYLETNDASSQVHDQDENTNTQSELTR